MKSVMNTGKPLFLVGTAIYGDITVTDVWTGAVIHVIPEEELEGVDKDNLIAVAVHALTIYGFPITRVVDRTKMLRSNGEILLWSMHGPATYSDFRIEYHPDLGWASLMMNSNGFRKAIHIWSNVESGHLTEFYQFAIDEIKKFKHTVLTSYLDEDKNMQFITYKSPLTVCGKAIAYGALWQITFCMLVYTAVSMLLDMTGLLKLENATNPSWFLVMIATLFASLPAGKRIAEKTQDLTELSMALKSRHFPRNRKIS